MNWCEKEKNVVQGKSLGFLIESSRKCFGQQNQNSLQLFCNNLAISYG